MFSILAGLLLLCVLIVIHELGHFLVAKALGVKVLTFSVGFGPKLIKWTKGETEYCISAIPLGGYVKMVGESPTEELTDEEKKVSFLHQPIWKKSAIAIAGPLFNLVLPIILFFFIFIGAEKFYLPIVGATVPGDPAHVSGIVSGDKILEIDGSPVSDFDGVIAAISKKPEKDISLTIERTVEDRPKRIQVAIRTKGEADPNPVNIGEMVGRIGILPAVRRPKITVIGRESKAARAGLQTFDEVLEVNSVPVTSYEQLERAIADANAPLSLKVSRLVGEEQKTLEVVLQKNGLKVFPISIDSTIERYAVDSSDFTKEYDARLQATKKDLKSFIESQDGLGISFADATIREVQKDSSADKVGLMPGDRIVSVDGQRVDSWFQIQKTLAVDSDKPKILGVVSGTVAKIVALRLQMSGQPESAFSQPQRMVLGARSAEIFKEGAISERQIGVMGAIQKGIEKTYELIKLTVKSLALLVTMTVPVSQIGGPIMIFDVAGQAASQGIEFYIFVMSLISVNLGLMNLLPIPVLDGGHLMMFLVEAVTRRPLTLKTRQIATQLGLAFVLGLMLLAIFNDIARLVS